MLVKFEDACKWSCERLCAQVMEGLLGESACCMM